MSARNPLFRSRSLRFLLIVLGARLVAAHEEHSSPGRVYPDAKEYHSADEADRQDFLPPLPEGTEQLRFREIYRMPVGEKGLEYSDRALALSGKRVRVLGYMVHEDEPVPGRLLLAPFPFKLLTEEYGLAEDLPATVIYVHMPKAAGAGPVAYTAGFMLLTGVLELGPGEEPDGRISSVRIQLDPPTGGSVAVTPAGSPTPQ